jgi:double-strand break repair protein MRE11
LTGALKNNAELPDESILAQLSLDTVKVEKLVKEFLTAQSLTILPQNSFGDAVAQFVDKDDKHAMEFFVNESLSSQVKHLLESNEVDEEDITEVMDTYRSKLEELFADGHLQKTKKTKLKPKPDSWESDMDGHWADEPGALIHTDGEGEDEDENLASLPPKKPAARSRGKAAATTRKSAATTKKAPAPRGGRGKKKAVEEDEEEDDDGDVIMLDDDDEDDDEDLFVKPTRSTAKKSAPRVSTRVKSPPAKTTTARAPAKQSTLNFSQPSTQRGRTTATKGRKIHEPSDDEISDDDDAFEPASSSRGLRSRR